MTVRPLTKKERAELRGYVAGSTTIFRAALFMAAVAVVGWVVRAVHRLLVGQSRVFGHAVWWAAPVLAFAVVVYVVAGRWTGGRALRTRIRSDLDRGEAILRRVVAVDAIEIDEQEDEGPGFFILSDDGRTWIFAGQYLDRLKGNGFPWTAFDIVEAPASRVFFGIVKAGDRLTPSGKRPPLTWEEARSFGALNEKYRVLDVDFDSLKQRSG